MDSDSLIEWKETLVSLSEVDMKDVEHVFSTLKRLVHLSLDIGNRSVQSTKVKVHISFFTLPLLRREVTDEGIITIASILEFSSAEAPPIPHPLLGVHTETLKLLRNLCAELPGNQARIMQVIKSLHNSRAYV